MRLWSLTMPSMRRTSSYLYIEEVFRGAQVRCSSWTSLIIAGHCTIAKPSSLMWLWIRTPSRVGDKFHPVLRPLDAGIGSTSSYTSQRLTVFSTSPANLKLILRSFERQMVQSHGLARKQTMCDRALLIQTRRTNSFLNGGGLVTLFIEMQWFFFNPLKYFISKCDGLAEALARKNLDRLRETKAVDHCLTPFR